MSKVQLELWKILFKKSEKDAFNMWNDHFTNFQKIDLWNNLELSHKFFKQLMKQKKIKIDLDQLDEFLKKISINHLEALVDIMLKVETSGLISNYAKLNILFNNSNEKFATIHKNCKKKKEYKLSLFLWMELEEQMRLFLFQKDPVQSDIMAMIIIKKCSL